jgi:hypothetical protein
MDGESASPAGIGPVYRPCRDPPQAKFERPPPESLVRWAPRAVNHGPVMIVNFGMADNLERDAPSSQGFMSWDGQLLQVTSPQTGESRFLLRESEPQS